MCILQINILTVFDVQVKQTGRPLIVSECYLFQSNVVYENKNNKDVLS